MAYDSFIEKGVEVLLIIANKVQPENLDIVTNGLKEKLPNNILVGTIPINNILGSPTVKEIAFLSLIVSVFFRLIYPTTFRTIFVA